MSKKGPILLTVDEGDLQRPDFFRMLGCEIFLGNPVRQTTFITHLVLMDLPKEKSSFSVLSKLKSINIQIISPFLISDSLVLKKLSSDKKSFKNLKIPYVLVVDSNDPLDQLLFLQPQMIIFNFLQDPFLESKQFQEWLKSKQLFFLTIWHFTHFKKQQIFFKQVLKEPFSTGFWISNHFSLEKRYQLIKNLLVESDSNLKEEILN